jgi:hypothetical protein
MSFSPTVVVPTLGYFDVQAKQNTLHVFTLTVVDAAGQPYDLSADYLEARLWTTGYNPSVVWEIDSSTGAITGGVGSATFAIPPGRTDIANGDYTLDVFFQPTGSDIRALASGIYRILPAPQVVELLLTEDSDTIQLEQFVTTSLLRINS